MTESGQEMTLDEYITNTLPSNHRARKELDELCKLKYSHGSIILIAARVAHEANRIYCESIGDNSQKPWYTTPEVEGASMEQQQSAIEGVKAISDNHDLSPRQSHEKWFEYKRKNGWVYGKIKDEIAKIHPCMVPYDDLPKEQKLKDRLFGAVVRAVLFGR